MMAFELYLSFVLATCVLMLIPGPNVALIVSNSVSYGTRYGLLTMTGTASAMVLQLALTACGLTAMLGALAQWFEWLRWIGVAYLLVIGIRQWRAPAKTTEVEAQPKSVREIYWRGLLVSLTNPKTLLFYGAFFPQFIRPGVSAGPQVLQLCLTFLALAVLIDGLWAVAAGRARGLLRARGRLTNRLSGGLLIAAAVGLGLARRRT